MGGVAILLSNKRCERRRTKYYLAHVVRMHRGVSDKCYKCVFQEENKER
jgi:3-ketoacyl-CoA synthase